MSVFWAICRQHVVLAWRGGHATLAVAFLFIGVTLMPFGRSEEHTSELQAQSTTTYAVCCLQKKKINRTLRSGGRAGRKRKLCAKP